MANFTTDSWKEEKEMEKESLNKLSKEKFSMVIGKMTNSMLLNRPDNYISS